MKIQDLQEYFEPSLYEMSNFNSATTGLPDGTKLWVRTEPVALPHVKYRIKINHPQKGSAVFAIWGDVPEQVAGDWTVTGKDLSSVVTPIQKTYNEIRAHIDGHLDTADLVDTFRANR